MTREATAGKLYRKRARVAAITVMLAALAVVGAPAPAHADPVDDLIAKLDDSSDKIRLSAALNLNKLEDPRAIAPLAKLLGNDGDKKVRSAAAVGLGKLLKLSGVKPNIKKIGIAALERAAEGDASEFVKAQASKALDELGSAVPEKAGGGGGASAVYVNVAPMSSKTGSANDPKFRALMQRTATATLGRVAPQFATSWPGGNPPSKGQLQQKNTAGFYVDGTLNELSDTGGTVSCKVSMLLASFPDKSVFGFLNGGARVSGGTSARDIALASEDCVSAVVEDLIAKKIVPTIKSKVP